ncbi:MAG TPA: FtsX-like permease family protein [Acetobacteraceae bacterium]|nr:FtsX-like permease family protein [Acetobacteraceae bacterium]
MILALRLARRELRGGVRGLAIVLLCLALGTAVIAAVGTLRAAIDRGLATDGRQLLGGDLAIEGGTDPLPAALHAWLQARGGRVSDVVQMRSMLVAPSGERQLIELKAVDRAWPLIGAPVLSPVMPIAAALAPQNGRYGLVAEQLVLDRLRLHVGDTVRLGTATFRISAALVSEPDQAATPSLLGPRVVIGAAALPATGLVVPGSMVRYSLRAALPSPSQGPATETALQAAFPDTGWRIRNPHDAAPGVTQFIDQTSQFLTLVGLTSLLVGGIGVANGVRAWLDARAKTIATLRCLGASGGTVFAVCLVQVLTLSVAGIVVGLAAGAALPLVAMTFLRDMLPVPPVLGVYPGPLLLAAAYGLLTALAFALWPLGRAARIPGGALFRDALLPEHTLPTRGLVAVNAGLALALVALTVATATDRHFALYFCLAALATLILFRFGALAVTRAARAVPRVAAPWARLGIANLHRPGNATALLLVSIGLGLSTLAAVALIEANVRHEVLQQLPANAPSFFFVDIQNDQLARFEQIVHAARGVGEVDQVPSMRARLVAVNGVPADQVKATPDTRWALRGDRGLTYAATPPPGTEIVAGHWWPPDYDGPPLVSFDAGLAKGWGVKVGDTIRVNVLGRDIDLTVASLRDIHWQTLSLNFALVASPGLLAHAPHTHIATVSVAGADQGALLRAVTDALPNVTGIAVADVLAAVATLLGQVATALAATGSLALAAGALVLVGAVAAGQRRRTAEAVVLKTLGATRAQIRAAWLVEFGLLGLAAGVLAAAVGTAASYAVLHYIMHAGWVFLPGTLAGTLLIALAMMLGFGYAGTAAALRSKPGPLLRNE